jgi:hypothetical protein
MDLNIFKTEQERAEARKVLPELIDHPGWKILVRALELNAAFEKDERQNRIERLRNFGNLEELYAMQDRIEDLEQYKDLPLNILKEIMVENEEESDEIYDTLKQ